MRPEDLFACIGEAPDEALQRAEDAAPTPKKAPLWLKRGSAAAACLALICLGGYVLTHLGGSHAGGGGERGLAYMYYAGPVLPLTVRGDSGALTALREVTLDFAPYETVQETYEDQGKTQVYDTHEEEIAVTDRYILTNPTGADQTVTLLYPYAGYLREGARYRPVLTVDGAEVETARYAGADVKGTVGADGSSYGVYEELLTAQDYQDAAFAPPPDLDAVAVAVYRLDDYVYAQDEEATNPTLQFSYPIDQAKTTVLGYGFNGRRYGSPRDAFSVSVQPDQEPVYLLVLGEDLADYTLQGYRDGGCDPGEELDGLTCAVTRYESTLGAMLRQFIAQWPWAPAGEEALFYDVTARLLGRYALGALEAQDPMGGMLEDYLSRAGSDMRVCYEAFSVTVPAGGSVEVIAAFRQDASRDFVGNDLERNGYDLAARLGSNLAFSSQSVRLVHSELVELLDQNFGFDPEAGITAVTLDPGQDHYWLQVAKRKAR